MPGIPRQSHGLPICLTQEEEVGIQDIPSVGVDDAWIHGVSNNHNVVIVLIAHVHTQRNSRVYNRHTAPIAMMMLISATL